MNIGETPNIAYETEEDQVIGRGLVAQGFGIAIVPYMDLLLKLDVKILPIVSPNCEQVLFMVHDERVFMPPAVQNFVSLYWREIIFLKKTEKISKKNQRRKIFDMIK